jgi:hypothetical protein
MLPFTLGIGISWVSPLGLVSEIVVREGLLIGEGKMMGCRVSMKWGARECSIGFRGSGVAHGI